MVSMSTSFCCGSNQFLNSNWNSIFCDSICMASLGHNCFLYVLFDVAHKRYVATSNVDLVDDMIVTVC